MGLGGGAWSGDAPGVAGSVAQAPSWKPVLGAEGRVSVDAGARLTDVALTLVNGHTSFLSLNGKHFTNEKNSHPFICRGRQRLKMQINMESW